MAKRRRSGARRSVAGREYLAGAVEIGAGGNHNASWQAGVASTDVGHRGPRSERSGFRPAAKEGSASFF